MPKVAFTRAPSAQWLTEDLHALWQRTAPQPFSEWFVSLHMFLEYCRLLRRVREQFEIDDKAQTFDKCLFFLRGGYFAFAYLNLVTSMFPRAVISGGLNHGIRPKNRLLEFIRGLRAHCEGNTQERIRLLIVDEVKSGTGLGTALGLIRRAMQSRRGAPRCDIDVLFYAIRPGTETEMPDELRKTVEKWSGRHVTRTGVLNVCITHFAGVLIGYDNAPMCGIESTSAGWNEKEAYELVKLNGGRVSFTCQNNPENVVLCLDIDSGCLVESLSYLAASWTTKPSSTVTQQLVAAVNSHSCTTCKALLRAAFGNA
jgi:hypothetical protein